MIAMLLSELARLAIQVENPACGGETRRRYDRPATAVIAAFRRTRLCSITRRYANALVRMPLAPDQSRRAGERGKMRPHGDVFSSFVDFSKFSSLGQVIDLAPILNFLTDRLGGPEIDDQLEAGRLLDRQISRFCAAE
jgi:hypothetical protein